MVLQNRSDKKEAVKKAIGWTLESLHIKVYTLIFIVKESYRDPQKSGK
jgi:3-methyladenine DNA glycosylase AlkD